MRYYEDLEADRTRELGNVTVTESDVVAFAERYDPLPYHLDADAAQAAGHEGLIASGYQTLSLVNGVVSREFRREVDTVAGLGIDDLRWPRPVYPGDTLSVHHHVVAKRPSESNPDVGIIEVHVEAENDDGETVISYDTAGVVKRRPD